MIQKKYSLKSYFTLVFAVVALVPLLLVLTFAIVFLSPIEDQQRLDHLKTAGLLVSSRIKSTLDDGSTQLQGLASLIEKNSKNKQQINNFIDNFLTQNLHFHTVYIANKSGRIEYIGLPQLMKNLEANFVGLDISQRQFFKQGIQSNSGGWSSSFLSAVGGRLAIAYSTHIGDSLIVGELTLDLLPGALQEIDEETDIVVMILDQSDQLVAHPNQNLSNQQINLSNFKLVANRNESEIVQFSFDQKLLSGIYMPIAGTNWSMLVSRPTEIENRKKNSELLVIGMSIFGSILVAFIIAIYFGVNLTNRVLGYAYAIKNLATGLKAMEHTGNHSVIAELDTLAVDIERTAKIINDREIELEIINKELESRVQKRTDDLHVANQELEGTLSKLKQTQKGLIQSEKMAALGSLVAGIAHELNTPIGISVTAITTQMEYQTQLLKSYNQKTLTKTYLEEYIADVTTSCEIIVRNLNRSANLIKSFKQVAVDQTSDQRRKFDLSTTIKDIILALHPIIKRTPHNVELALQDNIELDSFPGALGQVITNLINNSLIHGLSDSVPGVIKIRCGLEENDQICISISDNGKGIKPDIQHKIFDPFFTTNRGKGGSGLGLNIVHNLVTSILQGTIKLESSPIIGTEFEIKLPAIVSEPVNIDRVVGDLD